MEAEVDWLRGEFGWIGAWKGEAIADDDPPVPRTGSRLRRVEGLEAGTPGDTGGSIGECKSWTSTITA